MGWQWKWFHDQSPRKMCVRAGIQTCDPWLCSQTRYRLRFEPNCKDVAQSAVLFQCVPSLFVPKREKTYLLICAPNKDSNKYAQSDQSLRCPHEATLHPWLSNCSQWRVWSDCAHAQADLNLLWALIVRRPVFWRCNFFHLEMIQ